MEKRTMSLISQFVFCLAILVALSAMAFTATGSLRGVLFAAVLLSSVGFTGCLSRMLENLG